MYNNIITIIAALDLLADVLPETMANAVWNLLSIASEYTDATAEIANLQRAPSCHDKDDFRRYQSEIVPLLTKLDTIRKDGLKAINNVNAFAKAYGLQEDFQMDASESSLEAIAEAWASV